MTNLVLSLKDVRTKLGKVLKELKEPVYVLDREKEPFVKLMPISAFKPVFLSDKATLTVNDMVRYWSHYTKDLDRKNPIVITSRNKPVAVATYNKDKVDVITTTSLTVNPENSQLLEAAKRLRSACTVNGELTDLGKDLFSAASKHGLEAIKNLMEFVGEVK